MTELFCNNSIGRSGRNVLHTRTFAAFAVIRHIWRKALFSTRSASSSKGPK